MNFEQRERMSQSPILTIDTLTQYATQHQDMGQLKKALQQDGYSNTNSSFSLVKNANQIDIPSNNKRFFVFEENTEQSAQRQELSKIFPFVIIKSTIVGNITVSEIPVQASSLGTRVYRETTPSSSYIGAYELLDQVKLLIGAMKRESGALPVDIRLSHFAFVGGTPASVRLVPPMTFSPLISIREALDNILKDLQHVDPYAPYEQLANVLFH